MDLREKTISMVGRIREKPEPTRWAILAALTMISTALLIVFWVWNISNQFATLAAPQSPDGQSAFLPESFSTSLKNLAGSFQALRSGEDPKAVAEDLQKKTAEANTPPLESPSVLGYLFHGVADVVRFNLATVGTAFKNLAAGKF